MKTLLLILAIFILVPLLGFGILDFVFSVIGAIFGLIAGLFGLVMGLVGGLIGIIVGGLALLFVFAIPILIIAGICKLVF
ncbi:MAG: hypothetical protein DWP97_02115 [Calditrichaeota bacterium]|nr:MAG: hypothetical protein DWP97_02115 [Calditrichota bacterium]